MKKNVGSIDRILRLVVGLGLVGWGVAAGNPWGFIGIVPIATAAIGWCPAYLPFGISSCKVKEQ